MKEFNKFQIAQLKRTAQNVASLVKRKNKVQGLVKQYTDELNSLQLQIDGWQGPVKLMFDGYTTEDLVHAEVTDTGKVDPKTGKPIKTTKYVLNYPDTVIPVEVEKEAEPEIEATTEEVAEIEETVDELPFNFD